MSIRYKIILSLLLLTAFCLGVYIWIAKTVFENDKEVAVFESLSQTSRAQAFTLKQHIDETISFSSSLLSTFDPNQQIFSEAGQNLFQKRKDLVAFAIFEEQKLLAVQSKNPQFNPQTVFDSLKARQSTVVPLGRKSLIALSSTVKTLETDPVRQLILVLDLQKQMELLNFNPEMGGAFLAVGDQSLSTQPDFPQDFAQQFLSVLPSQKNLLEQTSIEKVGKNEFLISSQQVQFGDLRILNAVPKNLAFAGLDLLYKKSLQFFGLIFFIVLFVSVLMTQTLLKNLDKLTSATAEISKGHFDLKLGLKSKDEFGKLAGSFQHMSQEIKRLLSETQEKARMEAELKTAQTVQENLFPIQNLKNENVEITGLYRSASECGGDWWYYFEHSTGIYAFICDATGHGAPAALITAAAKATVNIMKKEKELDLIKLSTAFNYALYETAKGKILMTGFILHIKPDQTLEYVNASHEPPMVFGESDVDFIMDPVNPRFGQDLNTEFKSGKLDTLAGQYLLMYTDGITGQANKDGKEIGDRKFMRFLKQMALHEMKLEDVNSKVFTFVDEFRESVSQADDLTIVSVRFSKAQEQRKIS